MPSFFKRRRFRSKVYREFVARRPCCFCDRAGPSAPHHYFPNGGGAALKSPDWSCVPLCREHHNFFHDNRELPGGPELTRMLFMKVQHECMRLFLTEHWKDEEQAPQVPGGVF